MPRRPAEPPATHAVTDFPEAVVPVVPVTVPGAMPLDPGGPMLVDGPVDVVLPDGTRVRSMRPVVALCACRRSKRYPFCDTSHRERVRPAD